jgi:hypothetical protein
MVSLEDSMPSSRIRFALSCVFLLALSGPLACSDSLSTTTTDDGKEARSGGSETEGRTEFLLVPAESTRKKVSRGQTSPLKIYLYNKTSGRRASVGEIVSFEVVDGGESAGMLASNRTETDDEGAASVRFRAEDRTGRARIRVDHAGADPLTMTLRVVQRPRGTLKVDVVNTADFVVDLSDVAVRLYHQPDLDCKNFEPLQRRQPAPLTERSKAKPGTTATFRNQRADRDYTVTAVARGERGQLAAGACQSSISLERDAITEEELGLNLVPLRPEGRYELQTEWDFSRVLAKSGAIGKNLDRILDIFNNPGRALYDEMMNFVQNYVNNILGRALEWFLDRTGIDSRIQNAINRAIQDNSVLCKIREAGRDLRDTVANLHVRSELTIGRVQSNYQFQGRDNWLGVTLYWRGQCQDAYEQACSGRDRNEADERQKPCAAIRLTADSQGKLGKLGVVSSKWKGRITAYNTLRIDQHPLPLRYGRLIRYVLNQVILPELTNGQANSLTGAFSHWLGCADLAKTITGGSNQLCALGNACIDASRVERFCKSSVGSLFGSANLIVGSLEYDTDIYVGGEADLVETTSDGRVDYIENGVYRGYLSVSGDPDQIFKGRSDVRATWRGERVSTSSSGAK